MWRLPKYQGLIRQSPLCLAPNPGSDKTPISRRDSHSSARHQDQKYALTVMPWFQSGGFLISTMLGKVPPETIHILEISLVWSPPIQSWRSPDGRWFPLSWHQSPSYLLHKENLFSPQRELICSTKITYIIYPQRALVWWLGCWWPLWRWRWWWWWGSGWPWRSACAAIYAAT